MKFYPEAKVKFNKFQLLNVDSQRKRFIDVITSVISRKYLAKDDQRFYHNTQLDRIISENDITNSTIEDLNMYMDELNKE